MTENNSNGKPIRIIFTGGGTGGHLYPALAIATEIKKQNINSKILFIGTSDRIEAQKVPEAGFDFKAINIHGIAGRRKTFKSFINQLRGILEFVSGYAIFQSIRIIKKFNPQIVVGSGGYVCGPVLIAAHLLGIPTVILEQNGIVGKTNRLVSSFVSLAIAISPDAGKFFEDRGVKVEYAGNPVRPEILNTTREEGVSSLGINFNKRVISVFGGSLGSTPINNAMKGALDILSNYDWFKDNYQVVHITGTDRDTGISVEGMAEKGIEYHNYGFRDDIHNVIAVTDFAITRAGGTFLAELSAKGIPMLIIPWSGAAGDHQTKNAEPFNENGGGIIVTDKELSGEIIAKRLVEVLNDNMKLSEMAKKSAELGKPNATNDIIKYIYEIALKG